MSNMMGRKMESMEAEDDEESMLNRLHESLVCPFQENEEIGMEHLRICP